MILPNWLCKKNRKTLDEMIQEIEEHREITRQAGIAVDKMTAACIDGENHWMECVTFSVKPKKERRRIGDRNAISQS